jgi:hypothetical protein
MSEELITEGIAAVQAKNMQLARELLKEFIHQCPDDERGWGWLYNVAENDTERLSCVKEVIRINPNNQRAKQLLEKLRGSILSSPKAGKSTREMARTRRKYAIWIAIIGVSALVIFIVLAYSKNIRGVLGGTGFLIVFFLGVPMITKIIDRAVEKKLKEEKRALRGAKGEENIGSLLSGLSEDFYVLHDIESPYGNIDHIVFSRHNGIFLVETKAHGGKVRVEGDRLLVNGKVPEKDFIAQALKNSYWLRDEIGELIGPTPWITPAVVFSNAFVTSSKPVKGVRVINKKYLINLLKRQGMKNDQVWEQRGKIGQFLLSDE